MRFRLTFITGISLVYIILSLAMAWTGSDGYLGRRFFFTAIGILGWFIGNELVQLNERVADLEEKATSQTGQPPASPSTGIDTSTNEPCPLHHK